MPWLDLTDGIAELFGEYGRDKDSALERYCAEALRREASRAKEFYERAKLDPTWARKHREQSLEEFHFAGYGRRQRGRELAFLDAGQQRLLPDAICESREVNLHVAQFLEARKFVVPIAKRHANISHGYHQLTLLVDKP